MMKKVMWFTLALLMISLLPINMVHGFPGNENITIATVDDLRVNPSQYILWNMTVTNNVTSWVNLTFTYNATVRGPYNLTIGVGGVVLSNHTAPNVVGNYTVQITSIGAVQNQTLVGFIVDQFNITLNAVYTENEEDLYILITATGESLVDGHRLGANDTLIIEGETYIYSTQLGYFYGSYTRTTPGTLLVDTLTSMLETTYGITNGALNNTITLTWTAGTITRMEENIADGDWIGMILDEYTYTMGTLFFWTALMAILSIGFYNVGGVYVALFAWIMGWGVFSGLVHGQAQIIGYIFIVLGFGLAVVKLALDRRTT